MRRRVATYFVALALGLGVGILSGPAPKAAARATRGVSSLAKLMGEVGVKTRCEAESTVGEAICHGNDCTWSPKSCYPYDCNAKEGLCRSSCGRDRHCGTGAICVDRRCRIENWTCAGADQRTNGRESEACRPYACGAGRCRSSCTTNAHCAAGRRCKRATSSCI